MARVPRSITVIENHSVHKVWRGHNREWNLGSSEDKEKYLQILNEDFDAKGANIGADIKALCLMSNHSHEIFWVRSQDRFSNHMRRHHGRYGQHFNKKNGRRGKVAEDRPKTTLIQDGIHEMRTTFYVHANPLRAGIVGDLRNYEWSTHNFYAYGKKADWMKHVTLPEWYLKLGKTPIERQRKYRKLFARYLKDIGLIKQQGFSRLFYGTEFWVETQTNRVSNWRISKDP